MSKKIKKSDSLQLPKHQHKIMMCLAKCEAMNMSETNNKINGENTSTTRVFHELEKKGLIAKIGAKEYRGRQFPVYWLTGRGLAYVFLNIPILSNDKYSTIIKGKAFSNFEIDSLKSEQLKNFASSYLKNKNIDTYLEIRNASNAIAYYLDYSMFRTGYLHFEEMASYFIIIIGIYGKNEALKFLEVAKLPEEFYVKLKENLENIKKFLYFMEKVRD